MERRIQEVAPQIEEFDLLQSVINAVPTPIFYKNIHGQYLGCNTAFEEYIGIEKDELVGHDVFELFEPALAEVYHQADQALLSSGDKQIYEARVKFADGSYRDVMFHKAVLDTKIPYFNGVVGAILDISERKEMERQLRLIAHTDSLTGLANRYSMIQELENTLTDSHLKYGIYISIDLDDFKLINDSYGHPVGDKVLVEFSYRLKAALGERALVARIGGDEFAILVTERRSRSKISSIECLNLTMDALMAIKQKPILIETKVKELNISYSVGATFIESKAELNVEQVLQSADNALYTAKRKGKGAWSL